jgi:hypothetical protein
MVGGFRQSGYRYGPSYPWPAAIRHMRSIPKVSFHQYSRPIVRQRSGIRFDIQIQKPEAG